MTSYLPYTYRIVYFILAEWKLQQRACYSSVYCKYFKWHGRRNFTLNKNNPFYKHVHVLAIIHSFIVVHVSISLQKNRQSFHYLSVNSIFSCKSAWHDLSYYMKCKSIICNSLLQYISLSGLFIIISVHVHFKNTVKQMLVCHTYLMTLKVSFNVMRIFY